MIRIKWLPLARRLVTEGKTGIEIRKILYAEGCPDCTVRVTIHHLVCEALIPDESKSETVYLRNARAGVMHLVDLKRAGHSPCRTEFTIGHDTHRPIRPYGVPQLRSLCGSSAAMAAGL